MTNQWKVCSCLLAVASVTGCERSTSADALLAEIERTGPRPVLERLWTNGEQFDATCAAIETAEANWLEVARRLKPVSDAAASVSLNYLNYSVAKALPLAPIRVLALVGRNFTVDNICTSPFIEPEPGVAKCYEDQTLQALAAIDDPAFTSLARQCAEGVRLTTR